VRVGALGHCALSPGDCSGRCRPNDIRHPAEDLATLLLRGASDQARHQLVDDHLNGVLGEDFVRDATPVRCGLLGVGARLRIGQHHGGDAIGMAAKQRHDDVAADRDASHDRPVDPQPLEFGDDIVGVRVDGRLVVSERRRAETAQIRRDQLPLITKQATLLGEHRRGERERVQEDERL